MPEFFIYSSFLIYIFLFISIVLTLVFLYKISKALTKIAEKMDSNNNMNKSD